VSPSFKNSPKIGGYRGLMENHFSILNKVVISVAIRLSKEGHDFKAVLFGFS